MLAMMPLAPQLSVPHLGQISASPKIRSEMKASSVKPKLSFSIDSIVGKRKTLESSSREDNHESSSNDTINNDPIESSIEKSFKRRISESLDGLDRHSVSPQDCRRSPLEQCHSPLSNGSFSATTNVTPHPPESGSPRSGSLSPLSLVTNNSSSNTQQPPNSLANVAQFLNRSAAASSLPGLSTSSSASAGNTTPSHSSPMSPTPPGQNSSNNNAPSSQVPQVASMGHPNHPMMVAAAAAAAAASSAHQFPSLPSDYQHAAAFYPWFLRANPFAGRFPGMPFDTPLGSFLLPPFRKPKRIRTAFSPGQLLKLEQAFEKNHYVVGNERKQLANHLGLSETQVKVWFQNRRTKHKRQKQEDEESGSGSGTNGDNGMVNKNYSDDEEEIDLEDEECASDEQDQDDASNAANTMPNNSAHNGLNHHANSALKFANMHHLWYQSAMSAGLMSATDHHPPVTSSGSN